MKAPREKLINESYLGFIPIKFKLFQQRTQEREMSGRKINQECFKRNRMILVRVDSARSVWYLTRTHTHTHTHTHTRTPAFANFCSGYFFSFFSVSSCFDARLKWDGAAHMVAEDPRDSGSMEAHSADDSIPHTKNLILVALFFRADESRPVNPELIPAQLLLNHRIVECDLVQANPLGNILSS